MGTASSKSDLALPERSIEPASTMSDLFSDLSVVLLHMLVAAQHWRQPVENQKKNVAFLLLRDGVRFFTC